MKSHLALLLAITCAVGLPASAGSPGDIDGNAAVSPAIPIERSATAAASPAIPGFVIDYKVRFMAFGGDVTLSLQQTAANSYRVSAVTKARGLTKLLMGNELFEQAEFGYADNRIVPLRYQLDSGKKSGEDTGEIAFDWYTNTAASIHEGDAATLELGPDIYDRLSADIVVIMDLSNGRAPRTLSIAEKNTIREYTFTPQGDETIETPAGTFDTVRYLRHREGSSRSTLIWYARNAGYLPVRIEQLKDGKTAVTSVAKSVVVNPSDS